MDTEYRVAQRHKRPHHTDLLPLATTHASASHFTSSNAGRGHRGSASPTSSNSAMSLTSPPQVNASHYYHDKGLYTASPIGLSPKTRVKYFAESLPRRHSVLSPGSLAARVGRITVSSSAYDSGVRLARDRLSVAEISRNMLLEGVCRSELAKIGGVVSMWPSSPHANNFSNTSKRTLFNPTHKRLQVWGLAYLGNAAVADVYVRAVQLRRSGQDEGCSKSNRSTQAAPSEKPGQLAGGLAAAVKSVEITVQARILPRAIERKPFLIQRRFNLDNIRASASVPNVEVPPELDFQRNHQREEAKDLGTHTSSKRPNSDSSTELSKIGKESEASSVTHHRTSATRVSRTASRRTAVIPIHVEYALHYLPVLAAIIFSGHVRKGDVIDMPMSNPSAWLEVVSYIYTGKGVVTPAMKENILDLGGRVEEEQLKHSD